MGFAFRPGTWDHDIWQSVVEHNEYGLPDRLPSGVILDVGAHVGAFSYASLRRGAGRVYAVECDRDNFNYLRHNLHDCHGATERAVLIYGAAWSDAAGCKFCPTAVNTGGGTVMTAEGLPVPSHSLVSLIGFAASAGPVALCKLDIEGAEFACLESLTVGHLGAVAEWVGEYHEWGGRTVADLKYLFRACRYDFESKPTGEKLGLFKAYRGETCTRSLS